MPTPISGREKYLNSLIINWSNLLNQLFQKAIQKERAAVQQLIRFTLTSLIHGIQALTDSLY